MIKYVALFVLLCYCRRNFALNRSKRVAQVNFQQQSRAFICVQSGSCITTFNNTYVIDPRAEVSNAFCLPGQEPCYPQQSPPACGTRYIANFNAGDGSASFGAHPWQAYIINQTSFTGSGVLIDAFHVLTVAHKVFVNVNTPFNIRVYMGVWDPNRMTATQNFTVSRIMVHPNFDQDTLRNDLAVVRLSAPAVLGLQINIGTACLPEPNFSYVGRMYVQDRQCTVSGWGQTAFGAFDAPRKGQFQISIPIVDYSTCRESMSQPHILGTAIDKFLDGTGEICAGGRPQVDTCTQDGGSPLICQSEKNGRFYVAGLVAWGKRCGEPGVYGVYVNVPYYVPWIEQTTSMLNSGF